MRIKKKNVARLASISALGAGALGVAAGTAEAGTIVYQPINATVGPSHLGSTTITFGLSGAGGSAGFKVWWNSMSIRNPVLGTATASTVWASVAGVHGLKFKAGKGWLSVGSSARKWTTVVGGTGTRSMTA
jgi:hypothetical protein